MKNIIIPILLLVQVTVKAQMKRDTTDLNRSFIGNIKNHTSTEFEEIVFLLQQNKELSDRLDRAEKRIDSLERRPYLFIDNKGVRPGVWLTNTSGEYQVFIVPLNYK